MKNTKKFNKIFELSMNWFNFIINGIQANIFNKDHEDKKESID